MNDEERIGQLHKLITKPELRLGYVAGMFYAVRNEKVPKQLDLLNDWFGSLIIEIEETDGSIKKRPEYKDRERIIKAVRYHDHVYSGADIRITHIASRLIGTAGSNHEKERRTGLLIQKNIARILCADNDRMIALYEHAEEMIDKLDEEQTAQLALLIYMFSIDCADAWYAKEEYDRDEELYPFDDETFDQIIYNAVYQILLCSWEGLVNAWIWLLLGSLLRNECGRIGRIYDSSFIPLYRAPSESGTLEDKLHFLIAPEDYESVYSGDDLQKRFPGIEWHCDCCGAHLNSQEGFDDHLEAWQCRKCGHINMLDYSCVYENAEDWQNDLHRIDQDDILKAIQKRRKETEEAE